MKALINKQDFIGLDRCSWLFSGAETPTHRGVLNAVNEYLSARSLGPHGRELNAEKEWNCKRHLAWLMNGAPENIAIMSNSSEVVSMIAQAVPLQPGDNVVIHNLEFPSGVLPWLLLKKDGIEVRVVKHQDWNLDENDILNQIDERTKLIFTSHVSYLSGVRMDYRKLYESISKTNAMLVLDATQSLGVVPVDLSFADIIVSSTYKWLLSVHGGGIIAVNPQRGFELMPKYVGWRSVREQKEPGKFLSFEFHPDARRFELGYPSYPTVYALEYSTRLLLDIGVDRIEKHVLELGEEVIQLLASNGYSVITPTASHRRAGNISFLYDDAEQFARVLSDQGVYVMGSEGRVRISIHAFNDTDDIRRLGELLLHMPPRAGKEENR